MVVQQDLLTKAEVQEIFLIFIDRKGGQKRTAVKFKFADKSSVYLSLELTPDFIKPKKGIPAELQVFAPSGIYRASVILKDTETTSREVFYVISQPKEYRVEQRRKSARIVCEAPFSIKYDEFEIKALSYDLSLGGVAFYYNEGIPDIYKRFPVELTLYLPEDEMNGIYDSPISCQARFVRGKEKFFAYEFLNLNSECRLILKNWLLNKTKDV